MSKIIHNITFLQTMKNKDAISKEFLIDINNTIYRKNSIQVEQIRTICIIIGNS